MINKIYLAVAIGAASLGLSQIANAGWYGGDCETHYDLGGSGVCVEYTDTNGNKWHMNNHGGTPSYKGPFVTPPTPVDEVYSSGTMENFIFTGPTSLTCGSISLDCDLTLEGQVLKDGNVVKIQVVDGDAAAGDLLCGSVSFDQWPWNAGNNTDHTVFDGITINTSSPSYTGAFGNIFFSVWPFIDVNDAHIHDVVFANNGTSASSFSFDNELVVGASDTGTDCFIDGVLTAVGSDVDIYFE